MEIVMCPVCGRFKAVAAGIKRTRCPHCNRGMELKNLKVFFRSERMEEITAAMGELNVAYTRGGMFEKDYRRESEIFGELRRDAEKEREKLMRTRASAETRKKAPIPVAKAVEAALETLEKERKMPFTLDDFTEAVNRKRKMGEDECMKLLERMVEVGRLYMPGHGEYGIV